MVDTVSTTLTSSIYLHVIEDVMTKVRDGFLTHGGPDEEILSELKGGVKIVQAGVRLVAADRFVNTRPPPGAAAAPVHDLNAPYEGEEYENPTADMLFPPFDKVTRTKSRRKCVLNDGIMRVNDRDLPLNKATGEFDF